MKKLSIGMLVAFLLSTFAISISLAWFWAEPLALFWHRVNLFFNAIPQFVPWVLLLITVTFISLWSFPEGYWSEWIFQTRDRRKRRREKSNLAPSRRSSRIAELGNILYLSRSTQMYREELAKQLGILLMKLYGHSQPTPIDLDDFFEENKDNIPVEVLRFFNSWGRERKLIRTSKRFFGFRRKSKVRDRPASSEELEGAIQFLEKEWNKRSLEI